MVVVSLKGPGLFCYVLSGHQNEDIKRTKQQNKLKQHNKTAQSKVDRYPTSHFSPFNCCLSVISWLEKGVFTPIFACCVLS